MYRLTSTTIVLFWLVSMGLLTRQIFFPETRVVGMVPYELVLKKILQCEDQPSLIIYDSRRGRGGKYERERGRSYLRINRVRSLDHGQMGASLQPMPEDTVREPLPSDRKSAAEWENAYYYLTSDVNLNTPLDVASGLVIKSRCYFSPQLKIINFQSSIAIRRREAGQLQSSNMFEIRGDQETGKVTLQIPMLGLENLPPMSFENFAKAQWGSILGLGGFSEALGISDLGPLLGGDKTAGPPRPILCRQEIVDTRWGTLKLYIIEQQFAQNLTVKLYVSRGGEIWRVELPMNLEMESESPPFLP